MITLPENFLASTTGYIGEIFVDLWPIIALLIGLPFAFWVLKKLMSLFAKAK